jgi:two-component system phosphate regulon sensor histidine kinase PhoR
MTVSDRELVRMAHARAGELAAVTQQLLSLARARGTKAAVAPVPVDLGAVAMLVPEKLQPRADERRVAVTVEIPGDLGQMQGDPEALGDLISNLLENAIRYNPDGGTLWFRVRGAPAEVVIEVQDTGIGIPAEDLPRDFEEFYRSKGARELAQGARGSAWRSSRPWSSSTAARSRRPWSGPQRSFSPPALW